MQALVDRFEGDKAVLRIHGQELTVPRAELPKDTTNGISLFFVFSRASSEEEVRTQTAKTILNEILNDHP